MGLLAVRVGAALKKASDSGYEQVAHGSEFSNLCLYEQSLGYFCGLH